MKAFTDALRMELEKEGAPMSATLIKPAAIDTMFTVHAKNYLEKEPALPAPVYAPEIVARSILYAAQHPKRDVFVGGASKAISSAGFAMPRVLDKLMNASMFRQQQSDTPNAPPEFERNSHFWGVVHGSLTAVKLMKQHGGGAVINVGSEASDRSVSLMGTLRRPSTP